MPTTKTRSTRASRASSTRASRAKTTKANASPSTKRISKAENEATDNNSQLDKLFTDTLKDIYWAEKHLTKALPKMMKKATTDELKSAIEEHLTQTEEHVSRLEQVFEICGKKAQAKKCEAMAGLIEEANTVVDETESGSMTRDAGIIMSAQKVEHYEIATYGCLVTFARTLGLDEAADILEQTLEEEKETDEKLTQIAEGSINQSAEQESEEDEEENESEDEGTEKAKVEAEEEE